MLLGAELRFHGSDNDYLLFGLTEDFLYRHRKIMEMDQLPSTSSHKRRGFFLCRHTRFATG